MTAPIRLTVVIPAFNEAANVGIVIADTLGVLDREAWGGAAQLVVVDDGSADATRTIVADWARRDSRVLAAWHGVNRGFGAAVRTGYAAATGEFVAIIPADGEVRIGEVLKLLALMDGADLAVSRRLRDGAARREWLTRTFHLMMRLLTGFDPAGMDGIFVIRRDVLQQIPLRSNTGLLHVELLMQCARRRCRTIAGMMQATPRLSGESKVANIRTVSKIFWELVKLRWRLT